MSQPFVQWAGVYLGDFLILVGVSLVALAIFGGARDTIAATPSVRKVSGLLGIALLIYTYAFYNPRALHLRRAPDWHTIVIRIPPVKPPQPALQSPAHPSPQSPAQPASLPPAQPVIRIPAHPPAPPAPEARFAGRWKNTDPAARGVVFLMVEQKGSQLSVRAWGDCAPRFCDWGTEHALVNGEAATVIWDQGFVQRRMMLQRDGGNLRMVLDSAFRDHRLPQHSEEQFTKTP